MMTLVGWLFTVLGVALIAGSRFIGRRFSVSDSGREDKGAEVLNWMGLLDDRRSRYYRTFVVAAVGLVFLIAGIAQVAHG